MPFDNIFLALSGAGTFAWYAVLHWGLGIL
jgi:hypothetical protein